MIRHCGSSLCITNLTSLLKDIIAGVFFLSYYNACICGHFLSLYFLLSSHIIFIVDTFDFGRFLFLITDLYIFL